MLTKRLRIILDEIDIEDVLADIGCDHGYLACGALNKGISFVQLIDNKEGPLKAASDNLKNYLPHKYQLTLSDGLSDLDNKVDTVTICGMGGELINQILSDNLDKTIKLKKIILQANTKISLLRQGLMDKGFMIYKEKMVLDRGKNYEVIICKYNPNNCQLTKDEIIFGPCLLKEKNDLFINKWTKRLDELNKTINIKEIKELIDLRERIIKILKY